METGETEADIKKLRERGKRLLKNYGWSNEMYAALYAKQDGRCAGCGRPPKNAPLNVDHEHLVVNTALTGNNDKNQKWTAVVVLKNGQKFTALAPTKALAVDAVKQAALPYSVRGLLCPGRQRGCNRLLGRVDDIRLLENFLKYLKNPPAKEIVDKYLPI